MTGRGRWSKMALAVLGLWIPALAGGAQAAPVHFRELLPFVEIIKLPGWEIDGKASGATLQQGGLKVNEARARFRAGDKTLEVSILDFLGKPVPGWGGGQPQEMETAEEQVRTTQVQGFEAQETFRPHDNQGELNISVADRFWVKIDGDGIDSLEPLRAAAQQMDLKKLAALAK